MGPLTDRYKKGILGGSSSGQTPTIHPGFCRRYIRYDANCSDRRNGERKIQMEAGEECERQPAESASTGITFTPVTRRLCQILARSWPTVIAGRWIAWRREPPLFDSVATLRPGSFSVLDPGLMRNGSIRK